MNKRRRRIWVESLPARTLAEPATMSLLERFGLEPIVALPPEREDSQMLGALSSLRQAGIAVGLWPLLSDEDGYWPSSSNAASFALRVPQMLAFAARADVRPRTVAIDLEPRLPVTQALLDGPRLQTLAREVVRSITPAADEGRLRAAHIFAEVRQDLRRQGIESLAAVWPVQVVDLEAGRSLVGSLLGTPLRAGDWDVTCPMLYSSMIRAIAPTSGDRLLRWAYGSIERSHRRSPMSVSLGLVGTGKLGHEPVMAEPDELLQDVQTANRAGVDDLALFSLEGVLADANPERWLNAFSQPDGRFV